MSAKIAIIDESHAGQRIDNFLITQFKGVPHSRIYKALRKGEVRVNKGRIQATYRLKLNDQVRLPPLRVSEKVTAKPSKSLVDLLQHAILFENDDFMVINKPAGVAVHGGTDVACGLIEALRFARTDIPSLFLVHRLDRDTSGCLLLAKNRNTLLAFHELQKTQDIQKNYVLLVKGHWNLGKQKISIALEKNKLKSGERVVIADEGGKPSETIFEPLQFFGDTTLLRATLITGRTHQIRVHTSHLGFPIVGDDKYGDRDFDRQFFKKHRQKRLFLHAERLSFKLPDVKKPFVFTADSDEAFGL